MELRYDLTPEDFWGFQNIAIRNGRQRYRQRHPWLWFLGITPCVLYGVAFGAMILQLASPHSIIPLVAVGAGGTGVALSLILQRLINPAWQRIFCPRSPLMIGEYIVTVWDGILRQTTPFSQIALPISNLEEVMEDKERLYLRYDSFYALIVPKRAFTTEADQTNFLRSIGGT